MGKRAVNSSAHAIIRCFLVLVNIFSMIVGLTVLGFGLYIRFPLRPFLSQYFTDTVKDIYKEINQNSTVPGILDTLDDFTYTVAMTLFFVGLVLVILSVIACVGAFKSSPLLVLIHDPSRDKLLNNLKNYDVNGSDNFSATMNILMLGLDCCGINGQDDFDNLTMIYKGVNVKIPPACCKMAPGEKTLLNCENNATNSNSETEGCYDAFHRVLMHQVNWLAFTVLFILMQILQFCASYHVIVHYNRIGYLRI
ncbi:hypothetical protein SNE40_015978 [Patella caerulea]|uniref:Tetraspanin n=1 Tax=Patella caerulea TaxID=87958 RepID=A0AAN8JAX2_PATCE